MFWDITPVVFIAAFFRLVSYLAYSSTPKMEGACSSETLVTLKRHRGVIFQEMVCLLNIL
jgi:hypothetical protein